MTLRNVLPRRQAVRRARRSGDANVALIMFVMMTLVFGPVVGLHVFAAFGLQPPPASVVSRGVDATPPG